jgi:hypothetical protein
VKGGEKVMSMSKKVSVGLLSIVFLVALVSAVPVDAKKPYRWYSESYYTGDPEWTGEIWTEDGKHGAFYWDNNNDAYIFLGPEGDKVQKFSGIWWILWDDESGGGYIEGTHKGSYTYAIMQFTINGWVTDTSDDWSHVDGRKIHTVGVADFANLPSVTWFQIN